MMVAIGPVLLLLATILLGAVLLLAAFGIILWISQQRRRTHARSDTQFWAPESSDITGQDATSIVAPGK
jgi:hypothetical protein